MGVIISRLLNFKKEARVLLIGLDAAGKTTMLYKLKLNEVVTTIPTIGFNVETIQPTKNLTLTVWDVGGQTKIRRLWRHYYQGSNAVVYVVDSADRDRFEEARDELAHVLADEHMEKVPVLVFANKCDMPGAASPNELSRELGLDRVVRSHKWHVQASNSVSGDGLYEGFSWLSDELRAAM
jgi:small GTP-binding protein